MKLKKETLRWPHDQDKITSRSAHVLGFVYALSFINCLCFFSYIPSCEAHKQFRAEPAQYGLEINFKLLCFRLDGVLFKGWG